MRMKMLNRYLKLCFKMFDIGSDNFISFNINLLTLNEEFDDNTTFSNRFHLGIKTHVF